MSYVRTARDQENIPPALSFIRQVSGSIFLCEYFRGRQLRRYGNFGPGLKIKGHKVFAGWGYAVADNTKGLTNLLNKRDFITFYRNDSVELEVTEHPISVGGIDGPFIQTYYVQVKSKYFLSPKTIAALGVLNFYEKKERYRLFLWVQDYHLTKEDIRKRFGSMMQGIVVPSISTAEN